MASGVELSPQAVEAELEKILSSPAFRNSTRHKRFLSFVVKKALSGEDGTIKEYLIGTEVFDRPADFDPRIEPIVRVEAGRLRSRLQEYYNTVGAEDALVINLPKGAYTPKFAFRERRDGSCGIETAAGQPASAGLQPGISATAVLEAAESTSDHDLPEAGLSPSAGPNAGAGGASRGGRAAGGTRRWLAIGAASLAIAVAATALYRSDRRNAHPRAAGPQPHSGINLRPSVAVLDFQNLTRNPAQAWLSTALSDMLVSELAEGGKLRTIPGEPVSDAEKELGITPFDGFAPKTLARLRAALGADVIVSGAYAVLPSPGQPRRKGQKFQLRIDLRAQRAATGETISTATETGAESDVAALLQRAGTKLRAALHAGLLTDAEGQEAKNALPGNLEAQRLYAEGIRELRNFDLTGARDLLQDAAIREPQFALAHSALARVWQALGYDAKARREALAAVQLDRKLSPSVRLETQARYHELNHDWTQAHAAYRRLLDQYPDAIDYGLDLARVQREMDNGRNSLATIAQMRALPAPLSSDPRLDLEEAKDYNQLGDFHSALDAARRAEAEARTRGASLLEARALIFEGTPVKPPEHSPAAYRLEEKAEKICARLGDWLCAASALRQMAIVSFPDTSASLALFKQDYGITHRIGARAAAATALSDMGNEFLERGDLARARQAQRKAKMLFAQMGDESGVIKTTIDLANVSYTEGDLDSALKAYQQGLNMARASGEDWFAQICEGNIADVRELEGDFQYPLALVRRQLEATAKSGDKGLIASELEVIAEVRVAQGDFAAARKLLDQAEADARATGSNFVLASCWLERAQMALAEGRPADAERLARRSGAEAVAEERADTEGYSWQVLARSLLEQGKVTQASGALVKAQRAVAAEKGGDAATEVAITGDLLRAARAGYAPGSQLTAAMQNLRRIIARSRKARLVGAELNARLALAELELKSGQTSGQPNLQTLESDASRRGIGIVARQAEAVLDPPGQRR